MNLKNIMKVNDDLRLEFLEESFTDEIFGLTDKNRKFLKKWLPWVDNTVTAEDTLNFIKDSVAKHINGESFNCAVFYKDKIAGVMGLTEISKFENSTEIGYWLGKEFTGKGIMTKACKALVDYCFEELKLSRVKIRCEKGNKASRGVPERLGFFKQGILKKDGYLYGKYIDHVQYVLYKREWNKIQTL